MALLPCDIIIISKEHNEAKPRAGALAFAYRRASFADKNLCVLRGAFICGGEVLLQRKAHAEAGAFCEEYLIDLNATQAAIRAGYSSKTADVQSARLLVNVKVQERISLLRSKQSKRTEVTADKVIAELAAIAFADRTELAKVDKNGSVKFTPTDSLPDDVKKIISGIKEGKFGTEVSSYDKVKALELLGKHLGLWEKAASESNAASEVPTLYKALEADDE